MADPEQPGAGGFGVRVVGLRGDGGVAVPIDGATPPALPPREWVDLALRPSTTPRRVRLLAVDPARETAPVRHEEGFNPGPPVPRRF